MGYTNTMLIRTKLLCVQKKKEQSLSSSSGETSLYERKWHYEIFELSFTHTFSQKRRRNFIHTCLPKSTNKHEFYTYRNEWRLYSKQGANMDS